MKIFSKKGFTIIELVLFMAILGVFLTILSQLFHSAMDALLESSTVSNIDQNMTFLVNRLEYDIRRSDSFIYPANVGESGDSLQMVVNGQNLTYSIDNGRIVITTANGTDALSDPYLVISNLNFLRLGPASGRGSVNIGFTITSNETNLAGRPQVRQVSTTISQR